MHVIRTTAITVLSILVAGTQVARAEEPSLSRAQVKAELVQARNANLIPNGEQAYPVVVSTHASTATRAQVKAELARAQVAGLITNGEQEYPPLAAHAHEQASTVTRAQVKAELAKARAAGLISTGESDYPRLAAD